MLQRVETMNSAVHKKIITVQRADGFHQTESSRANKNLVARASLRRILLDKTTPKSICFFTRNHCGRIAARKIFFNQTKWVASCALQAISMVVTIGGASKSLRRSTRPRKSLVAKKVSINWWIFQIKRALKINLLLFDGALASGSVSLTFRIVYRGD